jgi:hypothetical protein
MNTHTALQRAARIEYAVLRTPLGFVDERVVQRFLDEDSVARQSFERALDAFDQTAAKWLREPAARTGRNAEPAPAEEVVVPKPAEPEPSAQSDAEAVAAEPEPVEAEQVEELAHELLEQEETETFSGELAESDDLRQVQAELNAKRLLEEQQGQ